MDKIKSNLNKLKTIEYIYLIKLREFIKTDEDIYKIGRTTQPNMSRFYQYPKNSLILFQMCCNNSKEIEKNIIYIFKQKYILKKDVGNEYFKGDYKHMIHDIYKIINNLK